MVCGLHPVFHEFVVGVGRLCSFRLSKEDLETVVADSERQYYALSLIGTPHLVEQIFILYRRVMIGTIAEPTAMVLAVALTAIEEATLRSTMVSRDAYLLSLMGYDELSDAELVFQRKVWAAGM